MFLPKDENEYSVEFDFDSKAKGNSILVGLYIPF